MNHPIIDFWKKAYSEYKVEENCYQCLEMPDPIISARFLKTDGESFNLVTDYRKEVINYENYYIRNNFILGRFKIRPLTPKNNFKVMTLNSAILDDYFWELMKNGFEKDVSFLKTFFPFCLKLNAQFKVMYLVEKNLPYACAVIGMTDSEAVILSTVIHTDYRDQKLTREIEKAVHQIAFKNNIKECFFWTKSEKLLKFADHVDRYLIYKKVGS